MPLVLSLCCTTLAVEVLLLMMVDLGEMVNPRLLKRVAKWIAALGAWFSRMEVSPTCT